MSNPDRFSDLINISLDARNSTIARGAWASLQTHQHPTSRPQRSSMKNTYRYITDSSRPEHKVCTAHFIVQRSSNLDRELWRCDHHLTGNLTHEIVGIRLQKYTTRILSYGVTFLCVYHITSLRLAVTFHSLLSPTAS